MHQEAGNNCRLFDLIKRWIFNSDDRLDLRLTGSFETTIEM